MALRLDNFDKMILDNDRTIKLSQMYTDESVTTLKKAIESTLNDAVHKV